MSCIILFVLVLLIYWFILHYYIFERHVWTHTCHLVWKKKNSMEYGTDGHLMSCSLHESDIWLFHSLVLRKAYLTGGGKIMFLNCRKWAFELCYLTHWRICSICFEVTGQFLRASSTKLHWVLSAFYSLMNSEHIKNIYLILLELLLMYLCIK